MNGDHVLYEEATPWPAWAASLVTAVFLIPAVLTAREAFALGSGPDAVARAGTAVLLAFAPVTLWLLLGRLHVQVTRTGVVLRFGSLPLLQRVVALSDIEAVEAVRYSPIGEFGGWGIRWGLGGKRAWTIQGNQAVRLTLRGGKRLYVGSRDPERLASKIRLARGGRQGSDSNS